MAFNEFCCFFLATFKKREDLLVEGDTLEFPAPQLHQYTVRLTFGDTQDLFHFFSARFWSEIVPFLSQNADVWL